MGMSTLNVIGIRNISDKSIFDKMKKVKDACNEAKIDYPQEVKDYFGDALNYDDFQYGVEEKMLNIELPLKDWHNDSQEGYELEIKDIPKDVKTIRFYNSW